MDFQTAITKCFNKYVDVNGRAARSEYWYWTLFIVIGSILAMIADRVLFGAHNTGLIGMLFSLGTFLPGIMVAIRRLHDLDKSGWWFLIVLIPLIGAIVILVWFCSKGTPGPNRFGADPLLVTDYVDHQAI